MEKCFFSNYPFPILVHACDEAKKGGCSQICNKRKENHECSCESGFVLEEDKMTCKKGQLCALIFVIAEFNKLILSKITYLLLIIFQF